MLSVKRLLTTTQRCSSGCTCNNTATTCSTVRRAWNRIFNRSYSRLVPAKLLIDEEDIKKYQLDPRVKAIAKKLLYSDYIEKKSLRYGDKRNAIMLHQLSKKVKGKQFTNLMNEPSMSVALKYLREDVDTKTQVEQQEESNEEEECKVSTTTKPVHMPYASIDGYKTVEQSFEKESEISVSDLNEKYKDLYEKYLAAKDIALEENLSEIIDDKESSDAILKERLPGNLGNIPPDWMTDYEQYDDSLHDDSWQSNYGTPNPDIPISSIPCGGCGALLHCQDAALPGYLPSELFKNQTNDVLRNSTCQRCHFMKNYNTALNVQVSADEYPALLRHIKSKKVAVILMVDLTDFPCSIWPGIMNVIGKTTPMFIVGNKVDLLPNDGPNFLKNVGDSLRASLNEMGVGNANIKSINLISAKTGFGIEQLINKLHKIWEYKGDVYLTGCTNVGKSSLFNALLRSDYCKVQAVNLIQRATISPWPGTTLNLLKFPILNPVRWRLYDRTQRLRAEAEGRQDEREYRNEKLKETKKIHYASLQGHIGQTFSSSLKSEGSGYFGHDGATNETGYLGFNSNDDVYKNSRFLFDTPGAIHPDQILHFLTIEELMLTLPKQIIAPRTFLLYSGQTIFIAGLGRLDFRRGCTHMECTVFSSAQLPVTICRTKDAATVYQTLLETEALVVPINDPERLKVFPALESKTLNISSDGSRLSVADVVLSSAGWIAIKVELEREFKVRAWTPAGKGIYLRQPALLSRSVRLKGYKIPNSPAYSRGKQVYSKM